MNRRPVRLLRLLLIAPLFGVAMHGTPVCAEPAAVAGIGTSVLHGAHGNLAVNQSAGIGNVQDNQTAIAVSGRHAQAEIRSAQTVPRQAPVPAAVAHAAIGAHAFAGAGGIIAVNQASGSANAQANLAGVAVGPVAEVSLDHLAGVRVARPALPDAAGTANAPRRERSAAIADSAFAGASGVVQVNQLAGSGNTALNAFALSVGASPR